MSVKQAPCLPPREVPRLIKREDVSSLTIKGSSSYSGEIFSTDSRYSDQSDDSKPSPVSSPNLAWRQNNRLNSNSLYDEHSRLSRLYTSNRQPRPSRITMHENDRLWYNIRSVSPELDTCNRLRNRESFHSSLYSNAPAIYARSSRSESPPEINYRLADSYTRSRGQKRTYVDDYIPDDIRLSYRRERTLECSPKKSKFNISSLLGLEDEKTSTLVAHKHDIERRIKQEYNVYR